LDDREVAGLRGTDKIELIEKIQSVYRRNRASRFVNLVRAVKDLKVIA
jgi:hypothetical protein